MRLSKRIKSISYLKANTAEIIRELNEGAEPLIVTQNGEAKVIVQDLAEYEKMQETMALLKIVALSDAQIEAGESMSFDQVFKQLEE